MAIENMKTLAIARGDSGELIDIQPKLLLAEPVLTAPSIAEKYTNPNVTVTAEGKWFTKHNRKVNMNIDAAAIAAANQGKTKYTMSNNEGAIYASEEVTTLDKEALAADGFTYKKLKYNKKVDARVWEGEGKVIDDIASLLADSRERKALMVDNSLCQGIMALHTAAGVAKPATFADGTEIKGVDGQPYTMPALVSLSGLSLTDLKSGTLTEAQEKAAAKKMVKEIFAAIDEIHDLGRKGKPTANWPYGRGNNVELDVRTHNSVALALMELPAIQGNVANKGTDLLANGVSFKVNGVTFTVDPDLNENFVYQILPLGTNSPVYLPKRYEFSTVLKDHKDFPNDWWSLTVSNAQGMAQSNKNMAYCRFSMAKEAGATLTAAFTTIDTIAKRTLA